MVSTSSITVQSLGKTVLRAPDVDAKMWCLCVFLSRYESVALCVRGVNFEQALCHNLCVDFHSVFIGFPK